MSAKPPMNLPLEKVLEFYTFSGGSVYFFSRNAPNKRFRAIIREVKGEQLQAEILDSPSSSGVLLRSFLDNPIVGTLGFKNRAVTFETHLLEPFPKELRAGSHLNLKTPENGTLTDFREFRRVSFESVDWDLKLELNLKNFRGETKIVSTHLKDISQLALAAWIDRSSGLALPGDEVTLITLISNGLTVLNSAGKIIRVDMNSTHPSTPNSYLVVISLDSQSSERIVKEADDLRRLPRYPILTGPPIEVRFPHPIFSENEVTASVSDITTSGCSLFSENINVPLTAGMAIIDASVKLPSEPEFKATLLIRNSNAKPSESGHLIRLGCEFLSTSPELMRAINRITQPHLSEDLKDVDSEDYEELMQFFFETGFIYKSKREQLQQHAPKILATYRKLFNKRNPLVKNIVVKQGGLIYGHLSGIRFFDNTWIVQHLTAKSTKGSSAPKLLMDAMANFFLDYKNNETSDMYYMVFYYRPNNLYPTMMFGEVHDRIGNPEICSMRDFQFCVGINSSQLAVVNPSIAVSEAEESDLRNLEKLLIEQGYTYLLRTEGLASETITKLRISEEFSKLGLYRNRRVFVAKGRRDADVAYAVCNYASPGINLSELTNSFRIFYSVTDNSLNHELATSLSETVIESYKNTEMPCPVLLADIGLPIPQQFKVSKVYRHWQLSSYHFEKFIHATEYVFKNLAELVAKYKQEIDEYDKLAK